MKWTVDMVGDVYKEIIEYEGLGVDICRRINYQAIADKLNAPKLNEAQRLWNHNSYPRYIKHGLNKAVQELTVAETVRQFEAMVQDFLSTLHVVPEKATGEMETAIHEVLHKWADNNAHSGDICQALLDYLRGQS